MAYDLIIQNGLIVDGTGGRPYQGSVAVTGNEIKAISSSLPETAKVFIDARGKVIAPGFIDVTNHSDVVGTLFTSPELESMVRQGVTTILGGNCGSSLAPLLSHEAISAFEKWRQSDMPPADWATVAEFLEAVKKIKPGVNFGTFVGYGTLIRGLSPDHDGEAFGTAELTKLKVALTQALKDGAFGLSTGLVYAHERVMSAEHLFDIARVLKNEGGVYKTHLRSESTFLLSAVNEAVRIGREAAIPVHISHLKAIGRKAWNEFSRALALIERAAESKVSIHFDVYPYVTTGSFLYLLLPPGIYEGGFKKMFERLKNQNTRTDVLQLLQKRTLHYQSIVIATAWKTKESVGKTIADIADRARIAPEEAILQLLAANEGKVTIFGRTVRAEHVQRALLHPLSIIATDGSGYPMSYRQSGELAHPRSFGTYPRFLRLAVAKWNNLTLEHAIKKITGMPAEIFSIQKRGILQQGNFADIVVFDPKMIKSKATFSNPYQASDGIDTVLVNGVPAVQNGVFQAARSGMILKRKKSGI